MAETRLLGGSSLNRKGPCGKSRPLHEMIIGEELRSTRTDLRLGFFVRMASGGVTGCGGGSGGGGGGRPHAKLARRSVRKKEGRQIGVRIALVQLIQRCSHGQVTASRTGDTTDGCHAVGSESRRVDAGVAQTLADGVIVKVQSVLVQQCRRRRWRCSGRHQSHRRWSRAGRGVARRRRRCRRRCVQKWLGAGGVGKRWWRRWRCQARRRATVLVGAHRWSKPVKPSSTQETHQLPTCQVNWSAENIGRF